MDDKFVKLTRLALVKRPVERRNELLDLLEDILRNHPQEVSSSSFLKLR